MAGLRFAQPAWLVLLAVVVLLAGCYLLAQRRRRRYTVRLATTDLLASVMPRRPGAHRHVPAVLLLLAMAAMVLALADPTHLVAGPPQQSILVVAMDTSPSMQATDVPPSRFVAEKRAVAAFVSSLPPGVYVGLVSFAATGRIEVAPTQDHQRVIAHLHSLQLRSNTSLTQAVLTSLNAIESTNMPQVPAGIVMLSDGASNVGQPPSVGIHAAAAARVPVSTISLGTPRGVVTLGGVRQHVPVDGQELRQIAQGTHGLALHAATQKSLHAAYRQLRTGLSQPLVPASLRLWFVLAGLVLTVVAAAGSLLWQHQLP